MGVVWVAHDLRDADPERRVALKFIKAAGADANGLRRFQREARAAMALSHPNIVRVYELTADEEGAPVMVMELLQGESLARRLAFERRLDITSFAPIFAQLVSAIGSAHAAGIVHRDLKPDNIFLVGPRGGPASVRVLDFGVAKLTAVEGDAAATSALTGTGAMLGTPFYMAPEQVFGEKDIDQRADIWALGVILYECLSGRRPFDGENFGQVFKAVTRGSFVKLAEVAPHLPRDLLGLCDRMLTIERGERLSDLREVQRIVEVYTDERAAVFSAPTLPLGAISADAFAPTLASVPPPAMEAGTGSPVTRERTPSPVTEARPRQTWMWPAAGLALACAAAVGLLLRGTWSPPAALPGPATGTTPIAASASERSAPSAPLASASKSRAASSPASASASAPSTAPLAPVARAVASQASNAKPSTAPVTTTAPPTTTAEAPATTPPPPATTKPQLAGGVAAQPGF